MKVKFIEQYPDYETYTDNDLYYTTVPAGLLSALKGLLSRYADGNSQLKQICDNIAGRIPCEPTPNWGWDFLVRDLSDLLNALAEKKLHKLMDFLCDIASEHRHNRDFINELNEAFQESCFGYRLIYEQGPYGNLSWELVETPEIADRSICETTPEVADICAQATDHLLQAKEQLQKTNNTRAWKDAMRDCLSAMEALVNQFGGDKDIDISTKALRASCAWGPESIVKDGLSIWHRMHDLYPDIRHGNHRISEISREEAIYWIDRIMAFVGYLARHKKVVKK